MTELPPLVHSESLEQAVATACAASGLPDAAACVIDLASSSFAGCRADENIYPASVIKIALMTDVYARYADGSLKPGDRVRIDAANLTPTSEPTPLVAGYDARMQELVDLMIERSDNIATNQLIDVLRRERVTHNMRALRMDHFLLGRKLSGADPLIDDPESIGRNALTPKDAARLLRLIALDEVAGAAEQRALLERCVHNDKLRAGLRPDDRFMHKTGETSTVSHDAGILQTADGARYVVVLYTAPEGGITDAAAINAKMAHWMRVAREHL